MQKYRVRGRQKIVAFMSCLFVYFSLSFSFLFSFALLAPSVVMAISVAQAFSLCIVIEVFAALF